MFKYYSLIIQECLSLPSTPRLKSVFTTEEASNNMDISNIILSYY